jgi:hypothetical protein
MLLLGGKGKVNSIEEFREAVSLKATLDEIPLRSFSAEHVEVKDEKATQTDGLSIVTLTFELSGDQIMPGAADNVKEIGGNDSEIKLALSIDPTKLIDSITTK